MDKPATTTLTARNNRSDFFTVIPRDIAHRKRIEEDLATRRAQLEEAQALAHLSSWHWDVPADTLTWSDELYRAVKPQPAAAGRGEAQPAGARKK